MTQDERIDKLLEQLNECRYALQHNGELKAVNAYLTRRIASLEQELELACAEAAAPAAAPQAKEPAAGCACGKCGYSVFDALADILSPEDFDAPVRGRLSPTPRTRTRGGVAERLWQSDDGTTGEWRAFERQGPATIRVF